MEPKDVVLELAPRKGEFSLREEDIIEVLEKQGSTIALVLFPGVQYYTGQWFPMENITRKAKELVSLPWICFHVSEAYTSALSHVAPGLRMWMGFGSRCWQCTIVTPQLGR
jgi:kynureninase